MAFALLLKTHGYIFQLTPLTSAGFLAVPALCLGAAMPMYQQWGKQDFRITFFAYHLGGGLLLPVLDLFTWGVVNTTTVLFTTGLLQTSLGFILGIMRLRGFWTVPEAGESNSADKGSLAGVIFISAASMFWSVYIFRIVPFAFSANMPFQISLFLAASFVWLALGGLLARLSNCKPQSAVFLFILHIILVAWITPWVLQNPKFTVFFSGTTPNTLPIFPEGGILQSVVATAWMSAPLIWSAIIVALVAARSPRGGEGLVIALSGIGSISGLLVFIPLAGHDFLGFSPVPQILMSLPAIVLFSTRGKQRHRALGVSVAFLAAVLGLTTAVGEKNFFLNKNKQWANAASRYNLVRNAGRCIAYWDQYEEAVLHLGGAWDMNQEIKENDRKLFTAKKTIRFFSNASSWIGQMDFSYILNGLFSNSLIYPNEELVGLTPGLYFAPGKPKTLVIGVGSGITIHGASRVSKSVVGVDIDALTIRTLEDFAWANKHVVETPNTTILNVEGYAYLTTSGEKYDVIINTSSYAMALEASKLYSREMMQAIKDALFDDGIYLTYFDMIQVPPWSLEGYIAELKSIFLHVDLVSIGAYHVLVGHDRDYKPKVVDFMLKDGEFVSFTKVTPDLQTVKKPLRSTMDKPLLSAEGQNVVLKRNISCMPVPSLD